MFSSGAGIAMLTGEGNADATSWHDKREVIYSIVQG